ncbi:unnamed protein product [marine sediment metagenome]|uniref:Uncharacterized protein n=1 Tax=marine sediment metagenome TaxID=412755 RepID=X0Y5U6_9ZZZZ
MKTWLTRDVNDKNGSVCVWNGKPRLDDDAIYYDCIDGVDLIVCEGSKDFKKFFGFTPRKGSCKQYELTLKEI